MEVRSVVWRTELMMRRNEGSVVDDRGDHVVVRSPDNPTFHWGNFLLLARPPQPGELPALLARFAAEVGAPPPIGHVAIGWDGVDGDTGGAIVEEELAAAGLRIDRTVALIAEVLPPPPPPDHVTLRPFVDDAGWAAFFELVAAVEPTWELAFLRRRVLGLRRAIAAGDGTWWGAFVDDALVATAGLFWERDLGRYQDVQTHPAWRRRGLAGALIHGLARHGRDEVGLRRLVICADQAEPGPERLYRALGFVAQEHSVMASRRPL